MLDPGVVVGVPRATLDPATVAQPRIHTESNGEGAARDTLVAAVQPVNCMEHAASSGTT